MLQLRCSLCLERLLLVHFEVAEVDGIAVSEHCRCRLRRWHLFGICQSRSTTRFAQCVAV